MRFASDDLRSKALQTHKHLLGVNAPGRSVLLACGPWFPKVFPDLFKNSVRVTRRDVFFVGVPAGDDRFSFPNLPMWGTVHEPMYGFPSVDGRGLKVCPTDEQNLFDPDVDERLVNPYQTKRARLRGAAFSCSTRPADRRKSRMPGDGQRQR